MYLNNLGIKQNKQVNLFSWGLNWEANTFSWNLTSSNVLHCCWISILQVDCYQVVFEKWVESKYHNYYYSRLLAKLFFPLNFGSRLYQALGRKDIRHFVYYGKKNNFEYGQVVNAHKYGPVWPHLFLYIISYHPFLIHTLVSVVYPHTPPFL